MAFTRAGTPGSAAAGPLARGCAPVYDAFGCIQRAAQSGSGVRAWRRRCGEAVEQGAAVVVEHFVAQADAVGGKHRTQLVRAQAQVVDGVAPGQLAHAAARGEAEGVGVEQLAVVGVRSEEHTSELQSLMRISYAVFCLKKKTIHLITIE